MLYLRSDSDVKSSFSGVPLLFFSLTNGDVTKVTITGVQHTLPHYSVNIQASELIDFLFCQVFWLSLVNAKLLQPKSLF